MNWLLRLKHWLEFLGGATDAVPRSFNGPGGWVLLAVWWMALVGLITLYCRQASKFIYIDF